MMEYEQLRYILKVPLGLKELLHPLVMELLMLVPDDIIDYAANYFEELVVERAAFLARNAAEFGFHEMPDGISLIPNYQELLFDEEDFNYKKEIRWPDKELLPKILQRTEENFAPADTRRNLIYRRFSQTGADLSFNAVRRALALDDQANGKRFAESGIVDQPAVPALPPENNADTPLTASNLEDYNKSLESSKFLTAQTAASPDPRPHEGEMYFRRILEPISEYSEEGMCSGDSEGPDFADGDQASGLSTTAFSEQNFEAAREDSADHQPKSYIIEMGDPYSYDKLNSGTDYDDDIYASNDLNSSSAASNSSIPTKERLLSQKKADQYAAQNVDNKSETSSKEGILPPLLPKAESNRTRQIAEQGKRDSSKDKNRLVDFAGSLPKLADSQKEKSQLVDVIGSLPKLVDLAKPENIKSSLPSLSSLDGTDSHRDSTADVSSDFSDTDKTTNTGSRRTLDSEDNTSTSVVGDSAKPVKKKKIKSRVPKLNSASMFSRHFYSSAGNLQDFENEIISKAVKASEQIL